jgi:folate-binding protein YgfZ
MNQTWLDFLTSQQAIISENNDICFPTCPSNDNALYPIAQLSILKVSGDDAAQFLQGQLTCNMKELTEQNSFFAGFCNAKGRVISTLLILKHIDVFLIILPTSLLEEVKNRLQKYVLRAKVSLQNGNDEFCLSGLRCTPELAVHLAVPEVDFSRNNYFLKLPNAHYLLIAEVAETITRWTELLKQGFQMQSSHDWQALDLHAGLAWLDSTNSEQFIPQMLNLDKLGGISLTKGCYTGQEVVARTHYLGKAKRELFLAETATDVEFAVDTSVIDTTGQLVGQMLTIFPEAKSCKLLLVLQTSAVESTELRLNNSKQDKIRLIPFATA